MRAKPRYLVDASDRDGQRVEAYRSRAEAIAAARKRYFELDPTTARVSVLKATPDGTPCGLPYAVYSAAAPARGSKTILAGLPARQPLASQIQAYAATRGLSVAAAVAELSAHTGLSPRAFDKWIYEGTAPSKASAKLVTTALMALQN